MHLAFAVEPAFSFPPHNFMDHDEKTNPTRTAPRTRYEFSMQTNQPKITDGAKPTVNVVAKGGGQLPAWAAVKGTWCPPCRRRRLFQIPFERSDHAQTTPC